MLIKSLIELCLTIYCLYNSCLQCMGAHLSRNLAFTAFIHLYSCFTFALYLYTSLQLHWSILDNPTANSQS